jgi:hypothetical protein
MKRILSFLICLLLLPPFAVAMSFAPCNDAQKKAASELSNIPDIMSAVTMTSLIASQVLWVASTSRDPDEGSTPEKNKNDMTLYWLFPSLSFEMMVGMSFPRCSLIQEKDGQILAEDTEKSIKTNTRVGTGLGLFGQWFSLTNTVDEDKRQTIKSIMAGNLAIHLLYEWLWNYEAPRAAEPTTAIFPYIDEKSTGLRLVYRF